MQRHLCSVGLPTPAQGEAARQQRGDFAYLFEERKGGGKKGTERDEIFHLLVNSPDGHNY